MSAPLGFGVGLALAAALLVLNGVDAALTLCVTRRGGVELNPLMDALLAIGPSTFVIVKMLLALVCAGGLVSKWEVPLSRQGLVGVVCFYAAVVSWDTYQLVCGG